MASNYRIKYFGGPCDGRVEEAPTNMILFYLEPNYDIGARHHYDDDGSTLCFHAVHDDVKGKVE